MYNILLKLNNKKPNNSTKNGPKSENSDYILYDFNYMESGKGKIIELFHGP